MSDTPEPILQTRGLQRTFHDGERELAVLQEVDLTVRSDEAVAILGRSGSGKSTLLHLLGMLDRPTGGAYTFRGQAAGELSERARSRIRSREVGFVFQHFHLLPELNALDNTLLPARVAGRMRGAPERARELLCALGLEERLRHRPSRLSGGEQQRVAIARALINEPAVLLCDEPTGNLDPQTAGGVLDQIFALGQRRARALVVVTHDEQIASRAGRRLRLLDGRLQNVPTAPAAPA
jgi:predicted ABC-type transport system involved in lysophospholipase L1 biosynthesis ATPase subunit